MSAEQNLAVLNRAREQWCAGNLDGYLQFYHPDATLYGYPGVEPGIANIRTFYQGFWDGFPGSQLIFEDIFATEDKIACRFVLQATHEGTFQGIPPTGKQVTLPGITILRFENGACVERWSQADFLGLLQQLGAIPT